MHIQSETLGARMAVFWIPLFLMAFSGRIESKNNMFLVEVKNDGAGGPDTGAGDVVSEEAGTDYADSEEHGHGYGAAPASKYGHVEPSYAKPVERKYEPVEPKYVPVEPKYVPVEPKYESAETVETYEPAKPKYEAETSYKHESHEEGHYHAPEPKYVAPAPKYVAPAVNTYSAPPASKYGK